MNTRTSMVVLVALALLAQVCLARADGTITNLSFRNLPHAGVKTCVQVLVWVDGTGQCNTFTLDLDDGSPPVQLPGAFPVGFWHAYSKAGSPMPTAQGQGNCHGTASATLDVAGPWITSGVPWISQVTPGGYVVLTGWNFGNLTGQILLQLKDPSGQPLPPIPLEDLNWLDTAVSGRLPSDISGVLDQQATFTVVAQCGAVSNAFLGNFTAKRDFAVVAPDKVSCTTSGRTASDSCNAPGGTHWPPECLFPPWDVRGGGVSGYHASGWGWHGNSGNDQFWPNLSPMNGWVLYSVGEFQQNNLGSGSHADAVPVSPGDANVQVNWYVDNCGMTSYAGDMIITGPIGVPPF